MTQPQSTLAPRSIALLVSLWAIAACVVLFFTTMREMLHVRDLPAVDREPPSHAPLSRHVLLFIPDAVRYDQATDPAWAPNFARHMRDDTHAVVWAGRITMTSAAVLSIGAGQRGSFSQIITNLNVRRANYNDIFANAKAAGLRTALAGDETWSQTFGKFDDQVVDANGMAIDVDNSREIFAAAGQMIASPMPPNLMVAHLIASDHQGHAHGSTSAAYRRFLLKFDADMQAFLDKVPSDWTVIALGDHGQTDTGAHGTDTEIMRKTPMFAYGPGIRRGVALPDLDQIDIGYTLAAVLGTSGAAHGLGVAVTEMLDVSPQVAGDITCTEARRIERLARAEDLPDVTEQVRAAAAACSSPNASQADRAAAGRNAVRTFETLTSSARQSSSSLSTAIVVLLAMLGLALPAWLVSRWDPRISPAQVGRFTVFGIGMAGTIVALTFYVERIPPPFHNVVRAALFVAANVILLYGLIRPSHGAALFERRPALSFALIPGALAMSYTANTQVESLVAVGLGSALWLFAPHADLRAIPNLLKGSLALPRWHVGLVTLAFLGLVPFGIHNDNPTPRFLLERPWLLLLSSLAAIVAWLAAGFRDRDAKPRSLDLMVAISAAVGCVLLRRVIPPQLGLAALIAFPIFAFVAAVARRFTLAFGLAFAAYAWVSRDIELIPVAGAALILEAVGLAAARSSPAVPASRHRPWAIATLVTVLFSATFLVRVGLQGGLDLANIDYGAGSFGHPDVSQFQVFGSAAWKYAAATMLLVGVAVRPLPPSLRGAVTLAFVVTWLARAGAIVWILFACRSSFWSAMRALADSPTALVLTAAGAMVLFALGLSRAHAAHALPTPPSDR